MRSSHLRSGATAIVLVLALLAATSAPAADRALNQRGGRRFTFAPGGRGVSTRDGVPKRPFDILERYFDLPEDQRAGVRDLRAAWFDKHRKGIEELEQRLDAECLPKLTALLNADDQAKFKLVRAALRTYHEGMSAAEREYREAWKQLTGGEPSWLPRQAVQLVQAMPGVDPIKRREIQRSIYRDLYRQQREEVTRILKEKDIERPANPRENRDLWREYMTKRTEVQARVRKQSEPAVIKQVREALPEGQVEIFTALVRALDDFLAKTSAVIPGDHGALVPAPVVGNQEPSLACDNGLAALEAECADITDGPDKAAFVPGAMGMGTVLDHPEPCVPGGGHDGVHIRGQAPEMRDDEGLGVAVRAATDLSRVDVVGIALDVAQHGDGAGMTDGREAGDPRVGRGQHLVARADAQGKQRGMNGRRAAVETVAVTGAEVGRIRVFHFRHDPAVADL